MRVMTHFSSMAPTGYPRIAPKSHAISARRHPQWATCNLRVESTPMGAAGRPLRRHRRRKSGIGGCSAGNHVMADTMDTLLTSRARRVAVQRSRAHPVPMKGLQGSQSSYLGKKYDLGCLSISGVLARELCSPRAEFPVLPNALSNTGNRPSGVRTLFFLLSLHCTPQESMAEQLAGGALCPRSGGPDGNVMAAQAERFGHRSADTGPIPQRHPAHFAPQSLAPAVAVGARRGARSRWVAWWRIFCSE